MRVRLDYGRHGLEVDLPESEQLELLSYRSVEPLADPGQSVRESLERPIDTAPLPRLAQGRSDACVVVCDITRPVPNELILTPLLQTLEAAGLPPERISLLVATGLHRPSTHDELLEMLGPRIVERYAIDSHRGQGER